MLTAGAPGVALIEYDDKSRELVDVNAETFRRVMSDDTAEDVSNFELVRPGDRLEILWSVAGLFFPCSILSYTSKQVAIQHFQSGM